LDTRKKEDEFTCVNPQGASVGFCSLTIKDNLWQQGFLGNIDELVVEESFRGKGIGKILVETIIDIARKIGCKKVELDSSLHRKRAHKFYQDMGFETRAYLFSKSI
jgi:GNAT superfamily N-acetyltransferase